MAVVFLFLWKKILRKCWPVIGQSCRNVNLMFGIMPIWTGGARRKHGTGSPTRGECVAVPENSKERHSDRIEESLDKEQEKWTGLIEIH